MPNHELNSFACRSCTVLRCRYSADRVPLDTSLKSKQVTGRASTHCHVSYGFEPRLPAEVGSGSATCPMAPDLASRLRWAPVLPHVLWLWTSPPSWGGLWRCHVSRGSLWAAGLKHKEKPSSPAYAAMHACSQSMHASFQGGWQGLHDVRVGSVVNACKHVATIWLQYSASIMDHLPGTATVPSDSTARRHTANRV
jgi:hypothetical protein